MCQPEQDEQATPRGLYEALGMTGPPSFEGSFIERRRRLYKEMVRYTNRLIDLQKDIIAIERILGV